MDAYKKAIVMGRIEKALDNDRELRGIINNSRWDQFYFWLKRKFSDIWDWVKESALSIWEWVLELI